MRTPQQFAIGWLQGRTSVDGGVAGVDPAGAVQKPHWMKQLSPTTPIVHGFPVAALSVLVALPPQERT